MSTDERKDNPIKPGLYTYFGIVLLALSAYWLSQLWLGPKISGFSVEKEALIHTIVANGTVKSPLQVEVASTITGKISAIPFAVGQSVRSGQVLVVLENKNERAAAALAKSTTVQAEARLRKLKELTQSGSVQSLMKAQTSLDKARKQYSRVKELSAKGFVSQDQLNDALHNMVIAQSQLATAQFQAKASRGKGSDYALAEVALNRARDSERVAREKLTHTIIKAEMDGVLISRNVEPGNQVLQGQMLMVLAGGGKTQLLAQVDGKNSRYLELGQQASVAAKDFQGRRYQAELSYINPAADPASGIVEVRFDVAELPASLKHDMTVSVDIEVARRADALTLAAEAIRDEDGVEPWVMVVDNGLAQRRAVKLGMRTNTKIEILEGLREGDLVVPASGVDVEEGKRLRLAKAG